MNDWMIELDCIWKTDVEQEPYLLKIGKIRRNRNGPPFCAKFTLPLVSSALTVTDLDSASIKTTIATTIEGVLSAYDAVLLDRDGNPLDIRALIPVRIDEYASVQRVFPPGHWQDVQWLVERTCQWVTDKAVTPFRMRFSGPRRVSRVKSLYAMSTNHPLLGDLMLRDSRLGSVHFFIGAELPEFAKWNRAKILSEHGEPLDWEALADKVVGWTQTDKESKRQAVKALLRESGSRKTASPNGTTKID